MNLPKALPFENLKKSKSTKKSASKAKESFNLKLENLASNQ